MCKSARSALLALLFTVLLIAQPTLQGYKGEINVTPDDYTKAIACLLAEREERSNGVNGMLGVLFVVRNRSKAGWFGGGWLNNMEAHNQFSSMTIKGDAMTVYYPDPRDPAFQKVMQLVDDIYDDNLQDLTNGALYYADLTSPAFVKDGWFDRNIVQDSNGHPRCAQIGTTTYFK
jgi:hypothetical protein